MIDLQGGNNAPCFKWGESMHEKDRENVILSAVQSKTVVPIAELCSLTSASEATIRRDVRSLESRGKIRRVHGGAEAINPVPLVGLAGRPFVMNELAHHPEKQAIAAAAVEMCDEGTSIIINGGTTTFQMVHPLVTRNLQVFTNSFPIAEHLLKYSRNTVMLPGGIIYREQNIVLSPYENDMTRNFYASKMFMSAYGIGPLGLMEADPLLIQAEQKLIGQADELIILADSSKFKNRSSLVLCALERVDTVITDDKVDDSVVAFLEAADVTVKVVSVDVSADNTSKNA